MVSSWYPSGETLSGGLKNDTFLAANASNFSQNLTFADNPVSFDKMLFFCLNFKNPPNSFNSRQIDFIKNQRYSLMRSLKPLIHKAFLDDLPGDGAPSQKSSQN
jgi:hypothetical protein